MTEPARVPEEDQGRTDPRTVVPLRRRRTEDDHETAPEPLLRNVFGAVIRAARHDQKRTLAEVADRAGVSVPYLSEMERGRKDPSSEMLAAVCRALDLDLVDLVSRGYIELIGQRVQVEAPRRIGASNSGRGDVLALAA